MAIKISKVVVKLTRLHWVVIMTLSKKDRSYYPFKTDKDSVKNKSNRKKMVCEYDAKKKSENFTVRFCT